MVSRGILEGGESGPVSSVNPTIVWDIVISRLFASASSSGLHWNVDPVGDKLVTGGAYRVVRQPVCPAMLIMCLGLAMGLRSWLGISLSVIVFLPSAVWRARLEEAALDRRFGEEWEAYRERRRFIPPFIF